MPDAESQPSERDETLEPEVAGVLRFELSGLPSALTTQRPRSPQRSAGSPSLLLASIRSTHSCCPRSMPATAPTGTSTTFAAVAALHCATSRWTG